MGSDTREGVRTSTFLLGTQVADRRQAHRNPDQWEFYVMRSGRGAWGLRDQCFSRAFVSDRGAQLVACGTKTHSGR